MHFHLFFFSSSPSCVFFSLSRWNDYVYFSFMFVLILRSFSILAQATTRFKRRRRRRKKTRESDEVSSLEEVKKKPNPNETIMPQINMVVVQSGIDVQNQRILKQNNCSEKEYEIPNRWNKRNFSNHPS